MDAAQESEEKVADDTSPDSNDDFKCEDISAEDELSLKEGEEDLEAAVKAIQDRAKASARPSSTNRTSKPPAVVDFLRNFLFQMGMTETLDCFQTEWNEVVQKGLLEEEGLMVTPFVHIENQRLENELKTALKEMEEYRRTVSAAAGTLARVQKNRDFHRMQHKRVVQEKNLLIEEMRKVKMQCNSYEPAVKRMNEKYEVVLKQVMLAALERDKAFREVNSSSIQHDTLCGGEERGGEAGVEKYPSVTQPRPPAPAHSKK